MRKHKWKLLGLLAPGLALAAGAFVAWPQPIVPGVTQENFDRVEVGMSGPEVEALLGEPDAIAWAPSVSSTLYLEVWLYMGGDRVSFDERQRVSRKESDDLLVRDAPSDNPLVWAKRQWRRLFP
jgi:hypothetical protein